MPSPSLPVAAGLLLALGGPPLVALAAGGLVGAVSAPVANALGQLALWLLAAAIVWIALSREGKPLRSLGWRPLRLSSLLVGLLAAAALVYVVVPLAMATLAWSGLPGFGAGLSQVAALPLGLRVAAVLTGGSVEELLYRGYAITRLEALTGSAGLAATLSVAAFALAHWPLWGPGPVLTLVFSGGFLAALFVWRRDLVANIIAHVVVDAVGLLFAGPGS